MTYKPLTLRLISWQITTRNIGFSYKTFRENFLGVCFLRISDEIFVRKHMSVKEGPLYTERWGVAACDWLLLPRKAFLGKLRPHMQKNWCMDAWDWLLLPRKSFLGKLRPHMHKDRWIKGAWKVVIGWSYRRKFPRKAAAPHAQRRCIKGAWKVMIGYRYRRIVRRKNRDPHAY